MTEVITLGENSLVMRLTYSRKCAGADWPIRLPTGTDPTSASPSSDAAESWEAFVLNFLQYCHDTFFFVPGWEHSDSNAELRPLAGCFYIANRLNTSRADPDEPVRVSHSFPALSGDSHRSTYSSRHLIPPATRLPVDTHLAAGRANSLSVFLLLRLDGDDASLAKKVGS